MQSYRVGQQHFPYFIEAGQYAARTNQTVYYNFHDEVYEKIDWKRKLDISLTDLYRARAEQIRNDYDYVIVAYSGGADSQNVLDTFVQNNIHLDEIVIWHDKDITNTEDNRTNREALGVALQRAQIEVAKNPRIKLRVIGSLETLVAFEKTADFDIKMQIKQPWGGILVPQRRGFWKNQIQDYKDLVNKNKKVALVWGYDKPMLRYDVTQKKYFTFFEDRAHGYLPTSIDLPIDNVLFYWGAEAPLIPVKQSQIIVENIRKIPEKFVDPYFSYLNNVSLNDTMKLHNGVILSRTRINSWIYPGWDVRTFSDGKIAGSFFHNPELDYWVSDKMNEDVVKIWADTGKYYRKIYKDFTKNLHRVHSYEQLGISVGFVTTKPYYIE